MELKNNFYRLNKRQYVKTEVDMEIKSVKQIKVPNYPLKEEVSYIDLKEVVPKKWVKNTVITIAMGVLVVSTLALNKTQSTAVVPDPEITGTQGTIIDGSAVGEPKSNTLMVAPLFLHGEGRGAFGCVMIAPPVFLSEQEALEIVNEVAKEYGLNFTDDDVPSLHNVIEPSVNLYSRRKSDSKEIIDLRVDFVDKDKGIVIEFVACEDVKKWKNKNEESEFLAGSYNTKDAAAQLQEGMLYAYDDSFEVYTTGVLYDPCSFVFKDGNHAYKDQDKIQEVSREKSVSELKMQAKDFFEWLKAQGII